MKCKSNKIGAWLDDKYTPADCAGDFRSRYEGALEALRVAGFEIDFVPAGRAMIHIVRPPIELEVAMPRDKDVLKEKNGGIT